jgi:hypothetical protein
LTTKKASPEVRPTALPPDVVEFIQALADAAATRDHKRDIAERGK